MQQTNQTTAEPPIASSAFKCDQESFNNSYTKTDHLQKEMNQNIIKKFAEQIAHYYEEVKRPLVIADLCCGYGEQTLNLFKLLQEKGIAIEKVIGYDVSPEMIAIAQKISVEESKFCFSLKNVETELKDVEEFDVVTSFFGLHWMNDINKAAKQIHHSLKPKGLLLTFTPLNIPELDQLRSKFIHTSRWKECFDQQHKKLKVFHSESAYVQAFGHSMNIIHEERQQTKFNFSRLEFIAFIKSWFPEVRHLIKDEKLEVKRDVLANAYLSEFVDSIPFISEGNLIKKSQNEFIHTQPIHKFEGSKK